MLRLLKLCLNFKKKLVLGVSFSWINKILDLMPPLLVAWVIDTVGGKPPSWIHSIVNTNDTFVIACFLSGLAFLIFLFESLSQWGYSYNFLSLSQNIQHALRVKTYNHLQSREFEYFENHRLGNSLTIINDDINQLERFLSTIFNELIQIIVLVIFCSAVMFSTSTLLASFALIPLPLIIIGSLMYQQNISPKYTAIRNQIGKLNSRLENNISGIAVIKSFTAEKFESDRVEKESEIYKSANLSAIKLQSIYVPIIRMAIAFGFAGVLMIGSYWILNKQSIISIGQLVLFFDDDSTFIVASYKNGRYYR